MRTMIEIHKQLLGNISVMEELKTVWTLNRMANALGSSPETTLTHCRIAEQHGRITILKKDRGYVIMPTSMSEKIKE